MRRLVMLLAAVVIGAAAASWYFADRSDGTTQDSGWTNYAPLELSDSAEPAPRAARVSIRTLSGLQTTVPDTLGYPERTARYALEDGSFRVRVMTRAVSDASDDGIVIQQLPRGGVTRRVGWTITIVVGRLS